MSEPVRIAIIGASGGMGKQRVAQFGADPRSRLVAACARNLDPLREVVEDPAVRLTTDPDEVYAASDVDAVVVSTCNVFHYEQVKKALAAGKHVLCEYPLVDDLERYDELVVLAREKGVVLHHSLTVRAEPHHRMLKEALPKLGEPRIAHYRYYGGTKWYVKPELRGDLFCGLHIHFIDQFVDLFGPPDRITAHGVESDGKVSATVMMRWASGLVGTIEFGMGFPAAPGYLGTIVTTEGWCGFAKAEALEVTVARAGERIVRPCPEDTSKDEDARSFLDEVLGAGGPLSDLETGRNAIALSLECSRQMNLA